MPASASASGIRTMDDMEYLSESLLRLLVHKKSIGLSDINAALLMAYRRLADKLNVQGAVLFEPTPRGDRIVLRSVYFTALAYGDDDARRQLFRLRSGQLEKLTLPIGKPAAGQAMIRNEPIRIATSNRAEPFYDPVEWSPEFPIHSLMAVPIYVQGRTAGCIELINKGVNGSAGAFSDEDLRIARSVAYFVSKAIERLAHPDAKLGDRDLAMCLARLSGLPFLEIAPSDPEPELLEKVGMRHIERYLVIPLRRIEGNRIAAALVNPLERHLTDDFEIVTGLKIAERVVTTHACLQKFAERADLEDSSISEAAETVAAEFGEDLDVQVGEAEDEHSRPIIDLANRIIEDACKAGASDIHIEPQASKLIVRYRIDGVCRPKLNLPRQAQRALISRLKIMCELDITERRLPQDGRIVFRRYNSRYDLDLRVSTAPMAHGESVVMRLLDKKKSHLPLGELGFSAHNLTTYRRLIQSPYGMILHTGPTGSGKSMTLFAALNEINSPETKIVTAEDPIEYTLAGINQLQVRRDIGLTFAAALRTFLRQDPDIILVGEIRDRETAEIAIEAALTGHLLFSTLHTNDAASTVVRLSEMKVEPFLLSTTIVCICAQRLVRRLCSCKVEMAPDDDERRMLERAKDGAPLGKIYAPKGCERCDQTGYKGRIGIHELLEVNEPMRHLIATGVSAEELKARARQDGMRTLFEDVMEKVKAGITSMQEACAAASSSESAR